MSCTRSSFAIHTLGLYSQPHKTHGVHTATRTRHTGCIQQGPQDTRGAYSHPHRSVQPSSQDAYIFFHAHFGASHALITSSLQQIRPEDLFGSAWLFNLAERDLERKSPGASIYISYINIYIYIYTQISLRGVCLLLKTIDSSPFACFQTFCQILSNAMA